LHQYICDHCKLSGHCERTTQLKQLPNTLMMTLKRFRHESWFASKLDGHITFDEDLKVNNVDYKLHGVVVHKGSLRYGHYISYVRTKANTWQQFDDDDTQDVSWHHVSKCDAYILIYVQVTVTCSCSPSEEF